MCRDPSKVHSQQLKKVFFVNFLLIFIYLASSISFFLYNFFANCSRHQRSVVFIIQKMFFNVFGFLRVFFSFLFASKLKYTNTHTNWEIFVL